jgi:hypothetical protein
VQDEVNSIYNPPGGCSTRNLGDNATHQQIEKCLQGYEDSYNYICAMRGHDNSEYPCPIKYSVHSLSTHILLKIAYNIGYGKTGGDSFMGDNTTQQQMDRCEKGISDAYNQFCVNGTPREKSQMQ